MLEISLTTTVVCTEIKKDVHLQICFLWNMLLSWLSNLMVWVLKFWWKECVAVCINICPWHDPMQFGIKVPGTPCCTPGCRWDVHYVQQNKTLLPIHETAPLFLYKHVILATHSCWQGYLKNIVANRYVLSICHQMTASFWQAFMDSNRFIWINTQQ